MKTTDSFMIYVPSKSVNWKFTLYNYKHAANTTKKYDSWKLWRVDIVDSSDNVIYDIQNSVECEWEGAISEVDTDDFIGGYHGDEYNTYIDCIIDGKIIDMSSTFDIECYEISITNKSYLNHCNTTTKVFDRIRVNTWTIDGMTVYNHFKATDSININLTAIGMLSAYKKNGETVKINKMRCNWKSNIEDIPTNNTVTWGTIIDDNKRFIKGEFFGDGVYLSAEITNYKETGHNYHGRFSDFVDRMKVYLYPISNYQMSSGEEFECTTIYDVQATN